VSASRPAARPATRPSCRVVRPKKRHKGKLVLHGTEVMCWKNGRVKLRRGWKNGVLHGLFLERFKRGHLRRRVRYEQGRPVGVYSEWHKNGHIKYQMPFKGGKSHGTAQFWHRNGRLAISMEFVHGVKHGAHVGWFRSGRLSLRGKYARGKKTGLWTFWSQKGTSRIEMMHQKGRKHGLWRLWRDGRLFVEGRLYRDVMHGSWRWFGDIRAVGRYANGQMCGVWHCQRASSKGVKARAVSCPLKKLRQSVWGLQMGGRHHRGCKTTSTGAHCPPCRRSQMRTGGHQ
jgi:antitoxin component YwqK of YwqJK toxin-antitoxin module